MNFFDINTALGHWPFQQLPYETVDALEERLKKYGVTGALAVNTHGLFYRDVHNANIELAQWISGNKFFIGCASINPAYPQWEKDLRICVEQFGFRAVRLTPLYHNYDPDGELMDEAVGAAEALGIAVLIPQRIMDVRQRHHMDVGNIVLPQTVFAIARRHPECRIVCTETLIVDEDLPVIEPLKNLYVETSRQLTCFTGIFRRIVDTIGAERVIFGSGAPFKEVLPSVIKIMDTGFSPDEFNKIASENAAKLLERKNVL